MSYSVGLYELSESIGFPIESKDDLHELVHGSKSNDLRLDESNFATSGNNGLHFVEVFGIILTNSEYYKFINIEDCKEFIKRFSLLNLDEHESNRIKRFIDTIECELKNGKILFFWCD